MKISRAAQGFLMFMKGNGYAPATVALYQYVLGRLAGFLEDCEVESLRAADLNRYFAYLRDGYLPNRKNGSRAPVSGSTLQNHWKGIRSFFNWAVEELRLTTQPDDKLRLPGNNPKAILPLSEEDVKALLKSAATTEARPKNRKPFRMRRRTAERDTALILFLLDTGLRAGELCRLNLGDVNIETGQVYVAPFGESRRKTKSRYVQIGKSTRQAAWRYVSGRPDGGQDDPLFQTDRTGRRVTVNSIRLLLKDLGNKVGVKDVHPHRFRHTFCIEFLRNGGDVFNLQALTGHADLEMIRVYLEIVQRDTINAHRRASPADHWKL